MNPGIEFSAVDYRNRRFSNFYAARDPGRAPGWFIWGRNPEYGGTLIRLCGRPVVKPRKHPHYNGRVRRGWHTKREAEAMLKQVSI